MSSDRNGAVGEAATAAKHASERPTAAIASGQQVGDDGQQDDTWFAPGPKIDADAADGHEAYPDGAAAGALGAAAHDADARDSDRAGPPRDRPAEWFLPTGRAGLLPDSMTVGWDDGPAASPATGRYGVGAAAGGAPPWAGEFADASASAPPPWETGPWPGPGGLRSRHPDAPGDSRDEEPDSQPAGSANSAGMGAPAAALDRRRARTVLTAGLMPLVVPGLVLGVLGLRQPGSRAVRKASWLAIAASVVWTVVIIVIVIVAAGGSTAPCGGYPAAVHRAYEKALTDLSGSVPASVQAADLGAAASLANASAASAGQIDVRTALFTMANDMAQARADIVALRPIPATLRQHLADDGAVPAGSCVS